MQLELSVACRAFWSKLHRRLPFAKAPGSSTPDPYHIPFCYEALPTAGNRLFSFARNHFRRPDDAEDDGEDG